jgi:hypothetical protein
MIMKKFWPLALLLVLWASPAWAGTCQVVSTIPAQGATVSANQNFIEVQFDRPVLTDRYSFVKNPDLGAFPQVTGKVTFPSPTACRLPVKLAPGTKYAIGVNTAGFNNFRDAGNPDLPCGQYMLMFSTAP